MKSSFLPVYGPGKNTSPLYLSCIDLIFNLAVWSKTKFSYFRGLLLSLLEYFASLPTGIKQPPPPDRDSRSPYANQARQSQSGAPRVRVVAISAFSLSLSGSKGFLEPPP
jgi:hypothetical protein